MPLNATDPAAYESIACGDRTRLKCLDCGRYGDFDAVTVAHSRNCELVGGRNKTVGPVATSSAPVATATCIWRHVGGQWLVSGPGLTIGQVVVVGRKDGTTSEEEIGSLVTAGGQIFGVAVPTGSRLAVIKAAAREGDLSLHASDDEIVALVNTGRITASEAMNQDT